MCFLNRFLIIAILAIVLVNWLPGMKIEEYTWMRLFAAFLGIANALVRPILLLINIQPRIIAVAIVAFIVNSIAFFLASHYYLGIRIISLDGGGIAFLVIWAVSTLANRYIYIKRDRL